MRWTRASSVKRRPVEKKSQSDQQDLIQQMQASRAKKNAARAQILLAMPVGGRNSPGRCRPYQRLIEHEEKLDDALIHETTEITLRASATISLVVFRARMSGVGCRVTVAIRQVVGFFRRKAERIVRVSTRMHVVGTAPQPCMGKQDHDGQNGHDRAHRITSARQYRAETS